MSHQHTAKSVRFFVDADIPAQMPETDAAKAIDRCLSNGYAESQDRRNRGGEAADEQCIALSLIKLGAVQAAAEPQETQVFVAIQGGRVHSVCADRPDLFRNVSVEIIDYDTDGVNHDDLAGVRQGNGDIAMADVYGFSVGQATISLYPDHEMAQQEATAKYWVHKGHETGGEILGPYDTPRKAGEAIGRLSVSAFELEGNAAVGERSFAIVCAASKEDVGQIVNEQF